MQCFRYSLQLDRRSGSIITIEERGYEISLATWGLEEIALSFRTRRLFFLVFLNRLRRLAAGLVVWKLGSGHRPAMQVDAQLTLLFDTISPDAFGTSACASLVRTKPLLGGLFHSLVTCISWVVVLCKVFSYGVFEIFWIYMLHGRQLERLVVK